jgi:ferric-dicitrate binding protein FerR (iron transport regulator)
MLEVAGDVTVKSPGAAEGVQAVSGALLAEGSEISTGANARAKVWFGAGALINLVPSTSITLSQLRTDAEGNNLDVITFEQGDAGFVFGPQVRGQYQVKVADATVVSKGKAQFETRFKPGPVQLRVLVGSITLSAHNNSVAVGAGKLVVYRPLTSPEAKSHARVVRLSYVSGTVTINRPGSSEAEEAMANTPIQQGFELSTSSGSYAEVEFENRSTARLGEQSKLLFRELDLDAAGDKLNSLTFEQGYATFNLAAGRTAQVIRHSKGGTIYFQPAHGDDYSIKVADATVNPGSKCEFRTDLEQDHLRVEVFVGSVQVATTSQAVDVGEGKVLERQSGDPQLTVDPQRGITKDAWDRWTAARDQQALLTAKDAPVRPYGPTFGFDDLNTYGEWMTLPNGTSGWLPYAGPGWMPYTDGQWVYYPGIGYAWVSGEPWGWLPYHCGRWLFDDTLGWYWSMPRYGCGYWEPSLVDWYVGRGWVGWAPRPPGQPKPPPRPPHPPGTPHPPRPRPLVYVRGISTVPTEVVQNRQRITPEVVSHIVTDLPNPTDRPPFEPNPRPAHTSTASATVAAPALASPGGRERGFPLPHGSAPPTILMGGDAAKESLLLSKSDPRLARQPLRVAQGGTLGGHLAVTGTAGEFRGDVSMFGGKHVASGRPPGPGVAPTISFPAGRTSASIISHGRGAGFPGRGFSGESRAGGGGSPRGPSGGGAVRAAGGGGGGSFGGGSHPSGGGFSGGGGGSMGGGGHAGGGGGQPAGGGHH